MKIKPPAGLPANAFGFIAPHYRRCEYMAAYTREGDLMVTSASGDLAGAIAHWQPWAASEGRTITAEGFILGTEQ